MFETNKFNYLKIFIYYQILIHTRKRTYGSSTTTVSAIFFTILSEFSSNLTIYFGQICHCIKR